MTKPPRQIPTRLIDPPNPELPFGDPCGRCGAATTHTDPRDRVCGCAPCAVCDVATGSLCGYCGRSLGCRDHSVSIEQHCATYCLATVQQRAEVDSRPDLDNVPGSGDRYRNLAAKLQRDTPRPWSAPVPPWRPRPGIRIKTDDDGGDMIAAKVAIAALPPWPCKMCGQPMGGTWGAVDGKWTEIEPGCQPGACVRSGR